MVAALVFIIIRTSKSSPVMREKWLPTLLKASRVISCIYRMLSIYRLFIGLQMKTHEILFKKYLNFIPCGDVNVNLYNPLHLILIQGFHDSLSAQGYLPFILKPTRLLPGKHKYSPLDQMWCNYSGGYDCFSCVINHDLSDRICPAIIYIKTSNKFEILFGN